MPENEDFKNFSTGLYYRPSLWNGATCVPAILSLENGEVKLSTANKKLLKVPLEEVKAKRTPWGTLLLEVGKAKYDFVREGSRISESYNQEMLETILDEENKKNLVHNLIKTRLGDSRSVAKFTKGSGAIKLWEVVLKN